MKKNGNALSKLINVFIIISILMLIGCFAIVRRATLYLDIIWMLAGIISGKWDFGRIIMTLVATLLLFGSFFIAIKNLLNKKSIFVPVLVLGLTVGVLFTTFYADAVEYYINRLFDKDVVVNPLNKALGIVFLAFVILLFLFLVVSIIKEIRKSLIESRIDKHVAKLVVNADDPIAVVVNNAREEIDHATSVEDINAIVEKAKHEIDVLRGIKEKVAEEEIVEEVAEVVPAEEPAVEEVAEVVPAEEPAAKEVAEVVPAEEPAVVIVEEPVAENQVLVEESAPEVAEEVATPEVESQVNYDEAALAFFATTKEKARRAKSFDYKLRGASDELKTWFGGIKNELLSYKRIRSRVSKSCDSFRRGRLLLAKINVVGKTIKVFFALDTENYETTKFNQKNVAEMTKYAEVPFMIRVRSNRGYKHAIELVTEVMAKNGFVKNPRFVPVDYLQVYLPDSQNVLRSLGLSHLLKDKIRVEEVGVLNDEQAACLIQTNKDVLPADEKLVNAIINIDDVSKVFGPHEIVNLESLKVHKLIGRKVNNVKVLGRGEVNKPLTVYANDFSLNAVKMIVLTGGNVIELK